MFSKKVINTSSERRRGAVRRRSFGGGGELSGEPERLRILFALCSAVTASDLQIPIFARRRSKMG